jgi:DNA (cytosine-5)-methyltransferase 1
LSERPTHLDLFSGIGGFALAAQWSGFETVAFVEKESFCQKILKQHWPDVPIFGDIFQFDGKPFAGVDLLTGGFPCQPFSQAGKRQGKEDDRYLWPEMLRVVSEAKPCWVLGENVDGLDGLGLDDCISDLESLGYEVAPPLEIPACAVGSDHPRNRIWIIAHLNRERKPQLQGMLCDERRWNSDSAKEKDVEASAEWRALLESGRRIGDGTFKGWRPSPEWFECQPGLGRLVHGIPNRTHRLEALGNAIVPQVAYQIIKEIRKLI